MLLYCLKCKKNTESKNPKVVKTKNGKKMLSLNCVVCGSKKSSFIKASVLISSLGIRAPSNQIPLLVPFLFYRSKMKKTWKIFYKQEINSCLQ